jgi:DNA-binding transcriptional ArsR family regulator
VAYWVNKHGLKSQHAPRHAARGAVEREQLEALLAEGLSIRAMAERLDVSYTTVRHWLRRHEIVTPRARRLAETAPARAVGAETTEAHCSVHGMTTFVRRGRDGFRCRLCRVGAVHRRRRELKRVLVEEAGGACMLCGYDRSLAGLHFHHLDPAEKSFALSRQGVTRSLASARAEARKCVLLCSNCHAEVETGAAQLPSSLLL